MKKILALSLAVIIIIVGIVIADPFKKAIPVQALEYRKGFSLVPKEYDSSGVKPASGFVLKSEGEITLEYLLENLSIDGMDKPKISEAEPGAYEIMPAAFQQNKLYTFRLKAKDGEEVTWTFQTSLQFGILGSLPENTGTNVPLDTGIEIYFTHKEFGDLRDYFLIRPKVDGSFERHGHAVVFVPKKKLEPGTLYTVTVKQGLPLEGSDQSLQQDYTFSFETAPPENTQNKINGNFYYRNQINEFEPNESLKLPFGFYIYNRNEKSVEIATTVYAYKNVDEFINAIGRKEAVPYWANYSYYNNKIESKGLRKVTTVTQSFDIDYYYEKFIDIPELEEGFYLIDSSWEDINFQTLVQVTDLGMYITDSSTKTLVWVNSLVKDAPVAGAVIQGINGGEKYTTDSRGIALFDSESLKDSDENYSPAYYYKVTSPDGKSGVLPCYKYSYSNFYYNIYGGYHYGGYGENLHWRYFQTDRGIYKPDDTVEFWGFLKSRYTDEEIGEITVEIGQGYWYWAEKSVMSFFRPYIGKPLVNQTIKPKEGFFEGSFKLPNLEPGGYQVSVKYKGEVLNSYYINVEDYVKPAYTMTVTKDKEAIFEGETVNFTVLASFFEGTPVADLDIRYYISSLQSGRESYEKTDVKGQIVVPHTPRYSAGQQGLTNAYFNGSATLPESGEIYGSAMVRVFINDIDVRFETEYENEISRITARVHNIDLTRLNNGTAKDDGDYLSGPVEGKVLSGQITKHTYVKIETGQYYDFINKKVQKTYRYEERTSNAGSFSIKTDAAGTGVFETALAEEEDIWYTADITCRDNDGKQMNFNIYLNNRGRWRPYYYTSEGYNLSLDKEKYRLGEDVQLTCRYGEEPLPAGSYLYIESQNGIRNYVLSDTSKYSRAFAEEYIPNYYVNAVYFNGKTYITQESNVNYDFEEKKLDITASSDKESYKPGDECIIRIRAANEKGQPVAARINLAIVDEAVFKLSEQSVNVLESLYSWVGSGITSYYSSHYNANNTGWNAMQNGGVMKADEAAEMGAPAVTYAATTVAERQTASKDSAAFDETYVRTEFKDTAYFKTITLDANGEGEIRFKLPDNVTSWRVTMAGISPQLDGGTGEADLKVTLPFFINSSMSRTYLVGDLPYIGVTAYGNSLKEGDIIRYQLTSPQMPGFEQLAEGKAFERVNLPMWSLEEGNYEVVVKALAPDGNSDGFRQPFKVVATFHEIEEAEYLSLKPGTAIPAGSSGMTTLLFSDSGRGKYLPALYSLIYCGGNRVDQKYLSTVAEKLLIENFEDIELWRETPEVSLRDYQNQDGGFGILPYSGSDLRTSALLASLVKDDADLNKLKQYFYSFVFSDDSSVSPAALYGLAVLGEPVLLELDRAAKVENLKAEEYIFLALAYAELGETPTADKLFVERLVPKMDIAEPYARIMTAGNTDQTRMDTALAAVLLSKLEREQKEGMFSFTADNWSKEILVNLEKLLYVISEIDKAPKPSAEFTYTYDGNTYTEELSGGGTVYLKLPSLKISDLSIDSVTGDISVVSIYKKQLTENLVPDGNLKVSRAYYNNSTGQQTQQFRQNDIVKVVISWDVAKDAIDNGYEITDYAPAGLSPIESPWRMGIETGNKYYWYYRSIDGQKVTFYVSRQFDDRTPFVYYARIVNPGTFTAEAPIIQGTAARDSLRLGEKGYIEILN